MALYVHVVDGVFQSAGPLPSSARRLDTGQIVQDLGGTGAMWQRACGYFDADTVHVSDVTSDPVKQVALKAAVVAAVAARTQRRNWLDQTQASWAMAKDVLQDYVDAIPPPPSGNVSLALLGQQVTYLYNASVKLSDIVIGIADATMTMASVLADLLDTTDVTVPT